MSMDLVQKTWDELGCKIRPLRDMVFIRTHPKGEPKTESGLLYLPPGHDSLLNTLPHQQLMQATVCAVGPRTSVQPGDKVIFTKLYFAFWKKLEDGTFFGWIPNDQIAGYPDEE